MKKNLKDELGFTLVEALISLVISASILMLLSAGILQSKIIKSKLIDESQNILEKEEGNLVVGNRQIEWHLFLNQLEHYLNGTINPQVGTYIVVVDELDIDTLNYVQVFYRKSGTNNSIFIRSKKNGYQPLLTRVHTLTFRLEENGWLRIECIFRNKEVYVGRIWIKSWVEEIKDVI